MEGLWYLQAIFPSSSVHSLHHIFIKIPLHYIKNILMATVPWTQMRGRKTVSGLILHKLLLWNWTNMGCTLPVLTLRFSESMLLFGHVWAYLVQLDRLASVILTQMDKRNAFVQFFSLEQELTVRVTQGVYEEWNSWLCSLSRTRTRK